MQTIVYINPLKPGKLEEYRTFSATNLGPRKEEYIDLLKRYGLKTTQVYYKKIGDKELITVVHDAEDDSHLRLSTFSQSEHPYDQWFLQQLIELHDFEDVEEGPAEQLFSLDTPD